MAAAVLLSSCVKDTLYDTPHPDYGKIAVTADWSARGEGIDIPTTWTVTMGDYTGTETSATHAPNHLFAPGSYTLAVWNPAEGIMVNGTTATIAAATGNGAGTDAFVNNAPGWFFTYTKQVSIEKDKDYPLTAAMKQQVRELTLIIKPTGDAAGRITEIVAHLTGAARTLDFATDTYGAASNVVLPFTKITEGDDAGKWKATVRLLGVTGTEQLLTGEIRYADGNPTPTTLKSDLTEALKEFNTGKGESLTLGGTLVETPEGMEVDGAEINGWEEVKGDDVKWRYKATGCSPDYQFRLYQPGEFESQKDYVVANIWDWDWTYTVNWYEDGVLKGAMQAFDDEDQDYINMVKGKKTGYRTRHLFRAQPSKDAKSVKVVVKNRFGEIFTEEIKL